MAGSIPGQPSNESFAKNAMQIGLWQETVTKKKQEGISSEDSLALESSEKLVAPLKKQSTQEKSPVTGDSVILDNTGAMETIPRLDKTEMLSSRQRGLRVGGGTDSSWLSRHKKEIVLVAVIAGVAGIVGYALLGSHAALQAGVFGGGHSGGAGFGGIF